MKNLVNIQNELKVPKGNFNAFAKYHYRSTEDIFEALKPILLKHGAQLTISDELVLLGERVFLKATASLKTETESVRVDGFAEISEHKGMSAEQATGTASSYARKYALNGLFLIDETEADADHQPKQQTAQTQDLTKSQRIIHKIKALKTEIAKLGGKYDINDTVGKSEDELIELGKEYTAQLERLQLSKGASVK
jgi:hypothetical protein